MPIALKKRYIEEYHEFTAKLPQNEILKHIDGKGVVIQSFASWFSCRATKYKHPSRIIITIVLELLAVKTISYVAFKINLEYQVEKIIYVGIFC